MTTALSISYHYNSVTARYDTTTTYTDGRTTHTHVMPHNEHAKNAVTLCNTRMLREVAFVTRRQVGTFVCSMPSGRAMSVREVASHAGIPQSVALVYVRLAEHFGLARRQDTADESHRVKSLAIREPGLYSGGSYYKFA